MPRVSPDFKLPEACDNNTLFLFVQTVPFCLFLRHRPNYTLTKLARELGCEREHLYKLCPALERKGLIKIISGIDNRSKRIELTEAGLKLQSACVSAYMLLKSKAGTFMSLPKDIKPIDFDPRIMDLKAIYSRFRGQNCFFKPFAAYLIDVIQSGFSLKNYRVSKSREESRMLKRFEAAGIVTCAKYKHEKVIFLTPRGSKLQEIIVYMVDALLGGDRK